MQDANGVPLIALPPVEMIRIPVALHDDARVGSIVTVVERHLTAGIASI